MRKQRQHRQCGGCCNGPDDYDGGVIQRFTINAPKEVVYKAFIDRIWYKNIPFGVAPDKLMETDLSDSLDIEYPLRLILCKMIQETIYDAKSSEYIKYKVESYLMPTSEYRAAVDFKDYYDDKLQIQCCRLIWTAQYNFKWSSCNACCPLLAIAFRKCMEYCYQMMAGALKTQVEIKKEK